MYLIFENSTFTIVAEVAVALKGNKTIINISQNSNDSFSELVTIVINYIYVIRKYILIFKYKQMLSCCHCSRLKKNILIKMVELRSCNFFY